MSPLYILQFSYADSKRQSILAVGLFPFTLALLVKLHRGVGELGVGVTSK